jgi:hypothetical protein
MVIQEGKLEFKFEFKAIKLDDSLYYRNSFTKIQKGLKAVDILAVDTTTSYLIEVKDYTHPDTKQLELSKLIEDIIKKMICSLAMLLPMRDKSTDRIEQDILKEFLEKKELIIVFHIELPPKRKTLKQSNYDLVDIKKRLKGKLKSITDGQNIKVVSKDNLKNLPWSVAIATP